MPPTKGRVVFYMFWDLSTEQLTERPAMVTSVHDDRVSLFVFFEPQDREREDPHTPLAFGQYRSKVAMATDPPSTGTWSWPSMV